MPKDDRLDLSSSGKSRSDPARGRMRANNRSRGRHSIDLGRDLKKHMAAETIDENVRQHLLIGISLQCIGVPQRRFYQSNCSDWGCIP